MIKLNDLAIGYNGEAILEHIDQEFDDGQSKAGITVWAMLLKLTRWQS